MSCEAIAAISDAVLALSALVGAIVAVFGLSAWRHELYGHADFALARQVMRLVYEIRNRFGQIRNALSSEAFDTQYERFNGALCELDVALLEAEVLWGNDLTRAKQALKECVSTHRLALGTRRRIQEARRDITDEEYERTEPILFGECDDSFGQTITSAVAQFEAVLRRRLNRKG